MSKTDTYYIGKRSVSSGGKTWVPNRVVTAKGMGMDDDQFAAAVKRGSVKKGTPPVVGKKGAAPEPPTVLRVDRIKAAIDSLFKEDGTRVNDEDFTQDDKPACDVLNAKALLPGEDFIAAPERDEVWEKYQEAKTAPGEE